MNNAIIPGSISSIAQQTGKSIAETFMRASCIVLMDVSGSMSGQDSRGGKSRFDAASEDLKGLQASMPGKLAVIVFADDVLFCPGGTPINLSGTTDLAKALRFTKVADIPGMKFILVSDGEPNDEGEALKVAKSYTNKIDVIYVGPETRPDGRKFLESLAKSTGGQSTTCDRAMELGTGILSMLQSGA